MSPGTVVGIAIATFSVGLTLGFVLWECVAFIRAARESIAVFDSRATETEGTE